MTLDILQSKENILVPPMTSNLQKKISRARESRNVRDRKLAGVREYLGVVELKPNVTEDKIKEFMESVIDDKDSAIEYLILNSIVANGSEKAVSYHLLSLLRYSVNTTEFREDQWISLFLVLADAADEMTKTNGPVAPYDYRISYISEGLAEDILRSVPANKRTELVVKAIEDGKAKSWVIGFVFHTLQNHSKRKSVWGEYKSWLKPSEIEVITQKTIRKIKEELSNEYYNYPAPMYMMLLWWKYGDTEEFIQWIESKTVSDLDFVRFVTVFSEKALLWTGKLQSEVVWIVYTEILEKIFCSKEFLERLKSISQSDSDVKEAAKELLRRIEFEEEAAKRGLEFTKFFGSFYM